VLVTGFTAQATLHPTPSLARPSAISLADARLTSTLSILLVRLACPLSDESRCVGVHSFDALSGYTQADLDKVALRLNQRPRKALGFQTLRVDFKKVLRRPVELAAATGLRSYILSERHGARQKCHHQMT
jgi:hypothetical protein